MKGWGDASVNKVPVVQAGRLELDPYSQVKNWVWLHMLVIPVLGRWRSMGLTDQPAGLACLSPPCSYTHTHTYPSQTIHTLAWTNVLKRHFIGEVIEMTNKYLPWCSMSLVLRKMKIHEFLHVSIRWLKMKKTDCIRCRWECQREDMELSCPTGKNTQWNGYFDKQLNSPWNVKHSLPVRSSHSLR